jgi:xylulokinase
MSEPGRRLVLAVDLGTGGPKFALVTLRGDVVWWEHHAVTTTYGDNGAALQDAAEWWRLVVDATKRGVAEADRGDEVVAVGVTGQWGSTVPVDEQGDPVGECVLWSDTQGAPHSRALVGGPVQGYDPRPLGQWIRRTGGAPSTSGADPVGHILHLERDRPEVARRTRWYLEPVDFLSMRFTRVAAASPASMTLAWLTDNRRPEHVGYDDTLVARAGIPRHRLPPPHRSGSVIAPVHPEVGARLGISSSARVVTGLPDLHAAAVGTGSVDLHETHMSIGTSGWISCPLDNKKTDLLRMNASLPGIGPHPYLLGNSQESAGRCLQWYRSTLSSDGHPPPSYADIVALAETAPPGSNDVIFTPWLTGERSPVDDRAARAGFHHVGVRTTSADLARAVLEGVALNTRWLLSACDHFTGRRLEPLRIIGGGAQSDLWCQIVADVCDRTVERVADPLLTGLRGVGLTAGVALGEIGFDSLRGLVPVDRTFRPVPSRTKVYDRLYATFPGLHRGQRRMFRTLS